MPSQVLLGLVVVAVGLASLAGQLGLTDINLGGLLATFWPLAIIVVGLAAVVTVPRAWPGPVVILAVGVLFQLDALDLVSVDVWSLLWPLAIILVGLSLLTGVGSRGTDDRTVRSAVFWWGSQRRTTSQDFAGGSLSAIMGAIEVDLRGADIVERAEISVFVFWGGVEVKVPPTWRVQIGGLPLLGGWEDRTSAPLDKTAPVLVVRVTSLMGGVEIKS